LINGCPESRLRHLYRFAPQTEQVFFVMLHAENQDRLYLITPEKNNKPSSAASPSTFGSPLAGVLRTGIGHQCGFAGTRICDGRERAELYSQAA
jgi:hypothetical protein